MTWLTPWIDDERRRTRRAKLEEAVSSPDWAAPTGEPVDLEPPAFTEADALELRRLLDPVPPAELAANRARRLLFVEWLEGRLDDAGYWQLDALLPRPTPVPL